MSATALADLTQESLAVSLPAYYRRDANILATLDAICRELERIEAFLGALIDAPFPAKLTSDDYGLLSIWEGMLGLTVAPPVTVGSRVAKVLATIRGRKSGAGTDWQAAVSTALGGLANWTHRENYPGDYQLTITLPASAQTKTSGVQVLPVATLTVDSTTGFDASGSIYVGGSLVTYTGVTPTTFTGCSGGSGSKPDDTEVLQGTAYGTGVAERLIRSITPAHIDLVLGYEQGYLVDISQVDEEPI